LDVSFCISVQLLMRHADLLGTLQQFYFSYFYVSQIFTDAPRNLNL